MSWIDLLFLVVIALHLSNGFYRGFLKMSFDLAGFVLVFIVALFGSRLLGNLLAGTLDPEGVLYQHQIFQNSGLSVTPENAAQLVAGAAAFVVLFIILSIIFRYYAKGFKKINNIPVIGLLNRIGGSLIGIITGIAFVYIIIIVISLIPVQFIIEALDRSLFAIYTDHYFTPVALQLKDFMVNFYINS